MKKHSSLLCAAAMVALSHQAAQAQTYQQVWADEFTNGYSADWKFDTGNNNGWGNNERQYYQQANATVAGGVLQITARRENVGGSQYTSARMTTKGKAWGYGKVEARIKMPLGNGLWPAFWMLGANIDTQPWPACGEIDILEHVNAAGYMTATNHWSDANNQHAYDYTNATLANPGDWHVYAVERDANSIRTSVDGVVIKTFNIANSPNGMNELHNNFFVLLNLAVGGDMPFAAHTGVTAVDESKLPATMYVDYVRVYQLTTPPATGARFIEAESYGSMSGVQEEACTDAGGGQNVGYIDTNDWMAYSNVNFATAGAYTVEYRVASLNGGRLSCDLNGGSTALGNLNVPATGGWQNWTTITQTINIPAAGTYNFGVFAQAGGWNLNWLRITKQGSAARAAAGPAASAPSAAPGAFTADLYPNPGSPGQPLRLALGGYDFATPAEVTVTDLMGRVMLRKLVTQPTTELSVDGAWASGTYVVRVSGGGTSLVRKVAIR